MKNLLYPEPVSGAAPKVPPTAKITVFSLPARKATAMLCQAQAHPLPIFRYDLMLEPRAKERNSITIVPWDSSLGAMRAAESA